MVICFNNCTFNIVNVPAPQPEQQGLSLPAVAGFATIVGVILQAWQMLRP
jgi:hypothetical protein